MYHYSENIDILIGQLTDPDINSDIYTARKVLKRVQKVATRDGSEKLLPYVVKLLASPDIVVKKLSAWFISQHAEQEDVVLLAVNTLLKDASDPNPMVRGLALRTLSGFPKPELVQYSILPVVNGLKDSSSYVRRTSVMACLKLHDSLPGDFLQENGITEQLYNLLWDQDPIVVTNAINVLEELMKETGGLAMNRRMAYHLLNHLSIFTEWGLVDVLSVLKRYRPKTEEETLDIMNIVDSYLKHNNSAVVLIAVEYFLVLIRDMPHLKSEVYSRAKNQVLHFLSCGNPELVFLLLKFVESVFSEHKETFQTNFRSFFCKYNEPLYVKEKKIEMLPQMMTEENATEILEELGMYCSDITPTLSQYAIRAVGYIAGLQQGTYFDTCVKKLLELLNMHIDYVMSNVLKVLQTLKFTDDNRIIEVMELIPKCVDFVTDDEGRCAILWLLGEYGEHLDDSPYILEEFISNIEEESNTKLRLCLLTAAAKLFLQRPSECQEMLGQLLEVLTRDDDLDIKDRVMFYYKLLKTDPNTAKLVICGK